MTQAQPYTITFLFRKKLANNTFAFYFKKPKKFVYDSGQYNRWSLPITTKDGKGSSRLFTISSSPHEDFLSFTTKI